MIRLFFFLVSFSVLCVHAQSDDFKPYNKKRYGSFLETRHELLGSFNYLLDYEFEGTDGGNLHNGTSFGLGIGYDYRISLSDYVQSVAIGFKAEWYPGTLYKLNTIIDLNLAGGRLGQGIWQKGSWFFLNGLENQVVIPIGTNETDWYAIIYLAELNYANFEFKWGLQTTWEFYKETTYLDDTFTVFKLTYQLGL